MSTKKIVITLIVVVGGLAAWYLFRPELLFINKSVNEELAPVAMNDAEPGGEPIAVLKGAFHGVAHETHGTATVYQLADGRKVLRFTGFETSNGPDVNVYLVAAQDAQDSDTVTKAGFVSLGPIKGNIGDQNYDLPADIDLDKYQAVTIWCRRFSVNFGTAPLTPAFKG